MGRLGKSPRIKKVPPKFPTYVVKAIWASTASTFRIDAPTEHDAWERAWKQIARTEGGDSCLKVKVLGRVA